MTTLGHIFPRGGVYYLQRQVNGVRRVVSLRTRDKREARKLAGRLTDSRAGIGSGPEPGRAGTPPPAGRTELQAAWSAFVGVRGSMTHSPAPATLAAYQGHFKRLTDWLGKRKEG